MKSLWIFSDDNSVSKDETTYCLIDCYCYTNKFYLVSMLRQTIFINLNIYCGHLIIDIIICCLSNIANVYY